MPVGLEECLLTDETFPSWPLTGREDLFARGRHAAYACFRLGCHFLFLAFYVNGRQYFLGANAAVIFILARTGDY